MNPLINFELISATEYARINKMSPETVRKLCRKGELDSIQTDGGHWKIKVVNNNEFVSRKEYDNILEKYNTLRVQIETIYNILRKSIN